MPRRATSSDGINAAEARRTLIDLRESINVLIGLTLAGYDSQGDDGKSSGYFTTLAAKNMPECWYALRDGVRDRSLTRTEYRHLIELANTHVRNVDKFVETVARIALEGSP